MLITPDHISEKSRALIRSASQAELEGLQRRSSRSQRLLTVAFLIAALIALAQALMSGKPTWALLLPFIVLGELARPARKTEADLLKIVLNPHLIDEIRRMPAAKTNG